MKTTAHTRYIRLLKQPKIMAAMFSSIHSM